MTRRILHTLSQRPSRTGSGITLDALVRRAAESGWTQAALVGVPAAERMPQIGALSADRIHRVVFRDSDADGGATDLPFPVPGMSDVMPYPSRVWSTLSVNDLEQYRRVWRDRLAGIIGDFAPDLVHANHIWLMSSLLPDVAPHLPLVVTCHATGLRQMALCPGLKDEVVAGCRCFDHFFVLRQDHRRDLMRVLDVPAERITVAGVGYRDDVFYADTETQAEANDVLYVGKYSESKGLPWLLDAVERLAADRPGLHLHVAGDGAGPEAEALRHRMQALAPRVTLHGALTQPDLAVLMRRCGVCVLPSLYEGVPLVLVEAAACGCRLVATALPGVVEQLQPHLGDRLALVPLPRLVGIDRPDPADLPAFVDALAGTLDEALVTAIAANPPPDLARFTWRAVSERITDVWRRLLGS